MSKLHSFPGSFHDPRGGIFHAENKLYRVVTPLGAKDFNQLMNSGLYEKLVEKQQLLPLIACDLKQFSLPQKIEKIYEVPRLPFVSYPFEWGFSALQQAAQFHLTLHLEALQHDMTLIDASAYNVQFFEGAPIFIDHSSFTNYEPGSYWTGHRQFIEQFMNPLLLQAKAGIAFNDYLRSKPQGLPAVELKQFLPWSSKLSWRVFAHVILPTKFANVDAKTTKEISIQQPLAKHKLEAILEDLLQWVKRLQPRYPKSVWCDYERQVEPEQRKKKEEFIADFINTFSPKRILDLGCHQGYYSHKLVNDERVIIGLDKDSFAIDKAFQQQQDSNFFPLVMDLTNLTPDFGFADQERQAFTKRAKVDALIALAIIHHLGIGQSIPLKKIVAWLLQLAPLGVIEFVPKSDPKVQLLLALKKDLYPDYELANFLSLLAERATIIAQETIPGTKRELIAYQRRIN